MQKLIQSESTVDELRVKESSILKEKEKAIKIQ